VVVVMVVAALVVAHLRPRSATFIRARHYGIRELGARL